MPRPIEFLFMSYATQAEYKQKTGKDAPAWNRRLPRKYWFDPKAAELLRRWLSYDIVGLKGDQAFVDGLSILREEAAAVNIPDDGVKLEWEPPTTDTSVVALPIKPLASDEYLDLDRETPGEIFGRVVIRKKGEEAEITNPDVAALEILKLVKKIWDKIMLNPQVP